MELLKDQAQEKEGSLWKYVLDVEWGSKVCVVCMHMHRCACKSLVGVLVTFPIAVTICDEKQLMEGLLGCVLSHSLRVQPTKAEKTWRQEQKAAGLCIHT